MNTKIQYNHYSIFSKALAAGGVLGLAGAASLFASYSIENPSIALLIKSAVFPIGLILIIFSGFNLFTGCVATFSSQKPTQYLINLAVVWLGNFCGGILAALTIESVAPTGVKLLTDGILASKCYNADILDLIAKGFCCNFLICLGITKASKTTSTLEKIALLFITVFMFIICNFEHSVANMFFIPFSMFCNNATDIGWLLWNLLPVTVGNFLGGWAVILYNAYLS